MSNVPDTRASLILRLPNATDTDAWREFIELYEPFLYRYARRRGLQDADAREMTQEVFLGVARAVGKWKPDQQQARFRTWLFRIARNQATTLLARRAKITAGKALVTTDSSELPAAPQDEVQREEVEYRRTAFCWAAERVRGEVQEITWNAFWMTFVQEKDVSEVASELQISIGMVYVARSRVIRRLKNHIETLQEDAD